MKEISSTHEGTKNTTLSMSVVHLREVDQAGSEPRFPQKPQFGVTASLFHLFSTVFSIFPEYNLVQEANTQEKLSIQPSNCN